MQDIHAIGGGGGGGAGGGASLFGGVGGGGDRRLRPHHAHHHHQNNQALKCPRCDSLNTKFCYYNNYNLSQPRHFCKSCRRYWTKGGVLRNVPVGGGCRKTKRSKPKQTAATSAAEAATTPPQQQEQQQQPQDPQQQQNNNNNKSSNSHTSSESSSLTATNTTPTANTTVEAVSSKVTATNNGNMFKGSIEIENSKLFSTNPSFEQGIYEQYPEIGNFTGLMASSSSENMSFGFSNVMNQQTTSVHEQVHHHHHQQQSLWQGGLIDQTVQNELTTLQNSGSRGGESGGGFGALDWQGSGDQGLFDLPNAVDQAYWSQNQWSNDQDHHPALYLPVMSIGPGRGERTERRVGVGSWW